MSLGFHSAQHADIRYDARLLVEQARGHHGRVDDALIVVQHVAPL